MKLFTKKVSELSEAEYQAAYDCNLGGGGLMRRDLRSARRDKSIKASAVMAWEGDELLGWALKLRKAGERHMYIYVKPEHRGKGVGRAISGRALVGSSRPLWVYPTSHAQTIYRPLKERNRVAYVPGLWASR
jgi:GNAT superfamily N-acetyltransferase